MTAPVESIQVITFVNRENGLTRRILASHPNADELIKTSRAVGYVDLGSDFDAVVETETEASEEGF